MSTVSRESAAASVDIKTICARFPFPGSGRFVTNNAASTQPPRDLLELYRSLARTQRALDGLGVVPGITICGSQDAARRISLVAFNLAGRDPASVAEDLERVGEEARAVCHCATLAHHAIGLDSPTSLLSFYFLQHR